MIDFLFERYQSAYENIRLRTAVADRREKFWPKSYNVSSQSQFLTDKFQVQITI